MKTKLNKKFWDSLLESSTYYEIKTADLSIVNAKSFKQLRNDLNFTQKRFADILGVSNKTIEKWEQGANPIKGAAKRLVYLFLNDKTLVNRIYSEATITPSFQVSLNKTKKETDLYSFYSAFTDSVFKKEDAKWNQTKTFLSLTC